MIPTDTTSFFGIDAPLGDDERLMVAVGKGSDSAFRTLVERYQGFLLNFFVRIGAQVDEAEDAVQETFLRIHTYRSRYRPSGSFRTFVFTVARRAWLDMCRQRERRRRRETPGADPDACVALVGMTPDERLDLEAGLNALPEGQRMVLVLSVYGGLKYEEIAEVMGIPEGTVKSRVFHGLRKLRAKLFDRDAAI